LGFKSAYHIQTRINSLTFAFAGVANAIDLADRFLPRLKSLNCEFIGCFLQVDEFFLHPRADAYP
jgi:hypothetical protein